VVGAVYIIYGDAGRDNTLNPSCDPPQAVNIRHTIVNTVISLVSVHNVPVGRPFSRKREAGASPFL